MKIGVLHIFLVLFFSFMLNSCASHQPNIKIKTFKKIVEKCSFLPLKERPEWIYNTTYIDKNYYYGVGIANFNSDSSEQIKESEMNAKKSLSEQIFLKIDANSMLKKLYYKFDTKEFFLKKYKSILNIESLNYLINIQIKERWLNRKTCELWTLAVVKKNDMNLLQNKILKQIKLYYEMIQNYTDAKDKYLSINNRIKNLNKALQIIKNFDFILIQKIDFLKNNINYQLWQEKLSQLKGKLYQEKQIALEKDKYKKINRLYKSIYDEQLSKKQRYNNINQAKQILESMHNVYFKYIYVDLQSKYNYYRILLENDFARVAKLGSSKQNIISKFGKPDKNIKGLSFDITAVKYKDVWALFENDRLKCIVSNQGLIYLDSLRKIFYSCKWYIKNQPVIVIKK